MDQISNYIDISYAIEESISVYPNNPGFRLKRTRDIDKGDSSRVSEIVMGSHTGTHIDAPSHFICNGKSLDQISLDRMNGRAKVVDATGTGEIDTAFLKSISIEPDDILLFKTDNSLNWSCDRILEECVTLTYDAADYLVSTKVKLIGIDYLTIEMPKKKRIVGRSIHKSLLGSDILVCEALRLKDVVSGIYNFVCMPLSIKGIDGCPVRCVII